MLSIGVLSDEICLAANVIEKILQQNNIKVHFVEVFSKDEIRCAFAEAVNKKFDILLLKISLKENYSSLKIMRFDIILLLLSKCEEMVVLETLLKNNSYLIVNNDVTLPKIINCGKDTILITCGFNNKSSVTISSIEEEFQKKIQCCFQRTFYTISGNKIMPQEISFLSPHCDEKAENILAAITACVVSDVKIEKIVIV